jgi:hypothetical protein
VQAPPVGGGLVDPAGHPAPLTDAELRTELAQLPYWAGGRRAISRTVTGPADRLDRLLLALAGRKADRQRSPKFSRPPGHGDHGAEDERSGRGNRARYRPGAPPGGTIAEALANLG